MEELGRNNPWSVELRCPRIEFIPCRGREILAHEAEEDALTYSIIVIRL